MATHGKASLVFYEYKIRENDNYILKVIYWGMSYKYTLDCKLKPK